MSNRRGEKLGWIGGWFGSFIWLLILSVLWLVQARYAVSLVGFGLFATVAVLIFFTAPWRHPETKYWKLFIPMYGILALSIAAYIWAVGGPQKLGLTAWNIVWLLPLLIPFATAGQRCWNDTRAGHS